MNREAELDKLLMDMVYLIQGYDHSEDCTELDRSAVNRTKAEIQAVIDRLVIEGRIDELKSRLEYTSIIANTGSHPWRKEVVLAQNLIDRIAVLTHKPQGDSRE